jgi:hypothetical protein
MTPTPADEIAAFREARPEVSGCPPQARTRAQALLLAAAAAEQDTWWHRAAAPRWRDPAWRGMAGRGRRLLAGGTVAAGAVAAGVAAALTLSLLPRSSPPAGPGVPASAAAVLRAAAATAARQPVAVIPGPGQYLYLKDVEMKGGGTLPARCQTMTGQEWMAADRSGRQTGQFPAGCGHGFSQRWRAGAIPRGSISWPLDLLAWQGLPTSPAALERAIVRRYETSPRLRLSSGTFVYAAQLLQLDAPPALRAALFRVLQRLPGVQALGPATDRLGRHGIAVGLTTGGARNELIFDPRTSRALEEKQVAVPPRQDGNNYLPPGTVLSYVLYVSTGVVSSSTATAPARSPAGNGTTITQGKAA